MKDERQKQISNKSWAIAGIFLMVCIGFVALKKFFVSGTLNWEFWVFFGAIIILSFSKRIFGDIEQPKSITGKALPVGNSKEEKRKRKINYALESAFTTLLITNIDVYDFIHGRGYLMDNKVVLFCIEHGISVKLTIIIFISIWFIALYILDYLVMEKFIIKRYRYTLDNPEED